jgi:adenylate cyclase
VSLKEFLTDIDNQVEIVLSSDFEIQIIDTDYVPTFNDSDITYDNLDQKVKKCKRLESCVLYVDMRDSTQISADKRPATLAKIYSSFVKSMIASARYFGGHVRNIIGDRVMVVFDKDDCFKKAIDTAILMNSVNKHILNKRIKNIDFKCGIGIDYGKMLIAKAGAVRRGSETEFYRSLVWLGKPANVASKLTDVANKTTYFCTPDIYQGNYYRNTQKWLWFHRSYDDFIDDLEVTESHNLRHKDKYFYTFIKSHSYHTASVSPILMTQAVYEGLKKSHSDDESIKKGWWTTQSASVKNYDGSIFGGDVIFPVVKEI